MFVKDCVICLYIWYRYIARDAIQLWNISSFHCYDHEKADWTQLSVHFCSPNPFVFVLVVGLAIRKNKSSHSQKRYNKFLRKGKKNTSQFLILMVRYRRKIICKSETFWKPPLQFIFRNPKPFQIHYREFHSRVTVLSILHTILHYTATRLHENIVRCLFSLSTDREKKWYND